MTDLGDFEGMPVTGTTIKVTNAGDGLSQAMKVDPEIMHQGETRYVVLECEVAKVTFEPRNKERLDGDQVRVHVLKAGTATLIDADAVSKAIEAQRERILLMMEEEQGVQRLTAMQDAHDAGKHKSLVEGCMQCEEEAALDAAGD